MSHIFFVIHYIPQLVNQLQLTYLFHLFQLFIFFILFSISNNFHSFYGFILFPRHGRRGIIHRAFRERPAVTTFLNRTRRAFLLGGACTRRRNVVYCRNFYCRNQIQDLDHVHPCMTALFCNV